MLLSEVNKLPELQDKYAQGTGGGGWDFENNRSTQNEAEYNTADNKVSEKFKVGGTVNYVNSGGTKVQNGSNLAGIMLTLMRTPPSFDLKNENGGYTDPVTGQQRQYFFLYDNPYFAAYESPHTDDVDRVYGNVFADYNPLNWLNISYRLGTDFYADKRKQIFATGSWQATDLSGEIFENVKRNKEIYSDLLINFSKEFSVINTSITLGNNLNHREYQDIFGRGRQLGVPDFYNLRNAAELHADEYSQYIRTTALFFIADLEFSNMLFLNVTGRNEWSSTFGPNQNNFFYPSANMSFVFTELLESDNILSFGKIRLAYAQSGISAPVYSSKTYFTQPFLTDGFTGGLSYPYIGRSGLGYSNIIGNPDLSPERVTGKEVGLDVRFFQGRMNFDLTLYDQLSTDILVQRNIPSSTGFRTKQSNSGEMSNKGIELMVSGSPVRTSDFNWDISVNYSRNRSEVLKLAEGVTEINIASAFTEIGSYAIVGSPYGAFFGTKWERTPGGDLIIGDDGLPLVQLETGGIGNPFPDWQSNVRNTFTFKGLSLTALLDIRKGGDIYAGTWARLNRQGVTKESAARERTFLIEGVSAQYNAEGDVVYETEGSRTGQAKYTNEANTQEISAISYWQNFQGDFGTAEQKVTDGSWVRLRELGLNYRWNLKNLTSFVEYIDISVTGRNLWLQTDYPGVDPETSLTGAGGDPEASGGALTGFDYFNNPGTKSYIFGLKFGF